MTALLALVLATVQTEGCDAALREAIRDEVEVSGFAEDSVETVVHCEGHAVQVTLQDPRSGRRWVRALSRGSDSRAEVRVAVQLVDLLHAARAEVTWASLLEDRAPVPPSVSEVTSRWSGEVMAGAAFSPGVFGVEPSLSGRVVRRFGAWSVGASALGTLRASRLRGTVGTAEFGFATAAVVGSRTWSFAAWELEPQVGLGMLVLWAVGHATDFAYEGRLSGAATVLLSASVSVWRSFDVVSLGVRLEVGVTPIAARLELPDVRARVGLPVLALSLGARW